MSNTGIFNCKNFLSLESINFQNGQFFKELTECIREGYSLKKEKNINAFFKYPTFIKIISIIKKFTNMSFTLKVGDPAVYLPTINHNHILVNNDYKEWLGADFWKEDINKLKLAMGKKVIEGSVSLKDSKVTGAYERIEISMYMPMNYYIDEKEMTAEETAAIMLHEIGHAFTVFEFVDRVCTTNQVLSGMTRSLDGTVTEQQKRVIYGAADEIMKFSKEQKIAIDNAKTAKELTIITLDASIQLSVSELGKSVYDANSCEQLADQFSTRHGAGVHLATGLNKLINPAGIGYIILKAVAILISIFATVYTFGLFFLLLVFTMDASTEIYDRPASRFNRIKLQNVERLKKSSISLDEKNRLIEENKTIDELLKFNNDNLGLIDTVAYYLRPSYRNQLKFNNLQKELEKLASSDLFTSAAKLSTI